MKKQVGLFLLVISLISVFSINVFAALKDGEVQSRHIQDGAVTSSKIGFYNNVIIVAPSGGDYTSPVDALNAITDASESNPYLVKIMPGVYSIGSGSVRMKEYVDIEGSGENTTTITGTGENGVIKGASNAEIRLLTVKSTGGSGSWVTHKAISNDSTSPKITNVTVKSSGTGNVNCGIANSNSDAVMSNVISIASGTGWDVGIFNSGGSPVMTHVYATGEYAGIHISGSTPVLTDVKAAGGTTGYTILVHGPNDPSSPVMKNVRVEGSIYSDSSDIVIMDSIVTGGIYDQGGYGNIKCINVYDGNYEPITWCQ